MATKSTEYTGPGLKPDARFGSIVVAKFVNCMMVDGKKSIAERIFYDALEVIGKKITDQKPVKVFETAIANVKPMLEVKSRRVGGQNYQVPIKVSEKRQLSLAIRWILNSSRGKKGLPMHERLARELIDAYNKEGGAMTVRENTHRMAEANKAFSHFAI